MNRMKKNVVQGGLKHRSAF